jgi:Transglycosylase SLT domain
MASLPPIPSNIAIYIQQAASGTGLPESVVAAQNYVESSYGSDAGTSSAGAEGPWQFLQSTWSGLTSLPFSDASNWADSTPVYITYMKQLLQEENGNVANALAAYNAGPGNLAAGQGYASEILSLAGQSPNVTVSTAGGSTSGSGATTTSATSGLFSWPSEITGFFTDAKTFVDALLWIVNPASWLRIGSFFIGGILILFAIWIFTKVGSDDPLIKMPSTIPVPVPA